MSPGATVHLVASARRFRIAIAGGLTTAFLAFSILAAFHGQWVALAIFLPCAAVAAFMTWLRYSRNQPVPFTAAALIALMGKDAIPPKNE